MFVEEKRVSESCLALSTVCGHQAKMALLTKGWVFSYLQLCLEAMRNPFRWLKSHPPLYTQEIPLDFQQKNDVIAWEVERQGQCYDGLSQWSTWHNLASAEKRVSNLQRNRSEQVGQWGMSVRTLFFTLIWEDLNLGGTIFCLGPWTIWK